MFWIPLALAEPSTPPTSDEPVPAESVPAEPLKIDPLLGRPFSATRPGQVDPSSPYWDLEVMYHREQHAEGAKLATERYEETGDPHLTLYIARFEYQALEGDTTTSPKDREATYERILALLERGIEALPDDGHLRFARGVVMARLGTTRGVLSSLSLADDIEAAWLNAIETGTTYHSIGEEEQLPCDAYLALGIYYRLIPDSWLVKMIAGVRGDLDTSLAMHEKSVACSGPRIRSLKEMGVTQLCIGTKRKDPAMLAAGRASIHQYLGIVPEMKAEFVDIKHGAALLADPSIACGYSRDGQQDLDEAKLNK